VTLRHKGRWRNAGDHAEIIMIAWVMLGFWAGTPNGWPLDRSQEYLGSWTSHYTRLRSSLLFHRFYGPCRDVASFRINFQASLSPAIFLQPLTPTFFRSSSAWKCAFHKRRIVFCYLIFVFPCIIIYGFIRTSLMYIV